MKQYIVKQTDKNVIEKIGETRFIVFANNFIMDIFLRTKYIPNRAKKVILSLFMTILNNSVISLLRRINNA